MQLSEIILTDPCAPYLIYRMAASWQMVVKRHNQDAGIHTSEKEPFCPTKTLPLAWLL